MVAAGLRESGHPQGGQTPDVPDCAGDPPPPAPRSGLVLALNLLLSALRLEELDAADDVALTLIDSTAQLRDGSRGRGNLLSKWGLEELDELLDSDLD